VPRYFFHFSDGKRQFTDGSGVELSGMAAARVHATKQVRELKMAMCHPTIQDLSGWSMAVDNAKGVTVFAIGFDLQPLKGKGP
jgi:hypothetical protein